MRKIGTETTDTRSEAGGSKDPSNGSAAKQKNWRLISVMGVILFLAAFVRVFFAYGVSAGSDFALSGGNLSSNNLLALDTLLDGGFGTFVYESLYYPYGSTSVAPMLIAIILYPIAAVANQFMADPTTAASFALALSGPLFGVLAVIPAYLLGKEITGKNLGGVLTALFLALCPVAVQETVFSNGTGLSLVMFFGIFAVYFLVKAIKAAGLTDGARDSADRKTVNRYAIISGVLLALAGLCWTGYRALVLPIIAVMVVQTLVDRFRGRDPMPAAFMYSIVVLIGALLPGIYFAATGLWDVVASGITVLALLASALCVAYSALAKKPWTLVLPIFIVVIAAVLATMWFAVPDLFSAVVSGNSLMNSDYQGILADNRLSLSRLTAYFGWMTFWFIPLIAAYRIFKIKQNVVSPLYMFVLVWLLAVPVFSCSTASEACAASIAFAVAFALMAIWILDRVDFKGYFSGIKTAEGKTKVKRLFKPIPFISIIMALFLVAGPNMFYVVDAGISSNETQDINDDLGTDRFGGIGYYVPTDDTWQVPGALDQLKAENPSLKGSMAGWIDYSNDIVHSGFDSMTDTQGNGLLELSQILLANGVDGSSTVAMLIAMLKYSGFTDSIDDALIAAGLSAEDLKIVKGVMDSADYKVNGKTVRATVTVDTETYGHMSPEITDANIKAMFLEHYLTENYQSYVISEMYDAVCEKTGKSFDHFLVSGDMLPLYYSDAFTQMALMAGYTIDSNSGAVNGMMDIDWLQYYMYGKVAFTYTDSMYNSLIYRMYIGMSPAEAGYKGLSDYISALQHADRSVQMFPGYGLSNYVLTYWHVMYNASDDADPSDKDGWVEMDAEQAIEKQQKYGGTINYLSGKPVVFSYVENGTGSELINGTVTNGAGEGVKGIRVSAIDSNGVLRATTYTGEDGKFMLNVPAYDASSEDYSTIVYYAASSGTTGGALLKSVKVTDTANYDISDLKDTSDVYVTLRYYNGATNDITATDSNAAKYEITFTGKNTGDVVTEKLADFGPQELKLDTYEVVVKFDGKEIYKGNYDVVNKPEHFAVFEIEVIKYTVNLKDIYSSCPEDIMYIKVSGAYELVAEVKDGSATFSIPKGDYKVSFLGSDDPADVLPYLSTDSALSINSDRTEDITVISAADVTVTGCDNSAVTIANAAYSVTFVPNAENGYSVLVPVSDVGNTTYTVSCIEDGKVKAEVLNLKAGDAVASVDLMDFVDTVKVTGTVKSASDKTTSASIKFAYAGKVLEFASDSKGEYTAYLPKGVEFSLYATNQNDALIKTVPAFTEDGTLDIVLKAANHIDGNVKWGSYDYPYTDVTVEFSEYNGEDAPVVWNFATAQHNSGNVQSSLNEYDFYMPTGSKATVSTAVDSSVMSYLWYEKKDDTAHYDSSSYVIDTDAKRGENFKLYSVKEITVNIDPDMVAKLAGLKIRVASETEAKEIAVGTSDYTFKLTGQSSRVTVTLGSWEAETHTEFYYNGDYYISAKQLSEDSNVSIYELIGVADAEEMMGSIGYRSVYIKIADGCSFSLSDSDRLVKVTSYKDPENVLNGYTWYQFKCEYDEEGDPVPVTMKATSKDKVYLETITFEPYDSGDVKDVYEVTSEGKFVKGTFNGTEITMSPASDMRSEYSVKGFVGVVGNGDMKVSSASLGLEFDVKIKDGAYSVRLIESDDWDFEYDVETNNIAYHGELIGQTINKDCRLNMVVSGDSDFINASNVVIDNSHGIMSQVTFEIPAHFIVNDSKKDSLYKITYGAGWSQIGFTYDGNDVSEVYVPAESSNDKPVYVTGWYNSTQYSFNSDLFLTLTGDKKYTVMIDDFSIPPVAAGERDQLILVNKVSDIVGDYQYGYSFEINNMSGRSADGEMTIHTSEGWYVTLTMEVAGMSYLVDCSTAADGTFEFTPQILSGVTKFIINYIPKSDAVASEIPDMKVTDLKVLYGAGDEFPLNTVTEDEITITGNTATIQAVHQTSEVTSSDMTAEGAGVFNEKGDMPVIVWVLIALMVLGIILTVWMASKRGVFARKN